MFGSTIGLRPLRAALPAALLVAVLTWFFPTTAHAADETIGIDVPDGAAAVWIDVEQAGLRPADVVVTAVGAGGAPRTVSMTATTFGSHGEIAAVRGRVSVTVVAVAAAVGSTPDIALTAVDATGTVLAAGNTRVRLVAGEPAVVIGNVGDGTTTVDTVAERRGTGALSLTGGGLVGVGLAVVLLLAGGGVLLWRRLYRRPVTAEGAGR